MKKFIYILPFLAVLFTSCLEDDENSTFDYAAWRKLNDEYVTKMENLTENGNKVYTKVTGDTWAPDDFVLIKWHNDRSQTAKNLVPLSTSTVNIKYEMEDVEGNDLGNSYALTANGDSIYQSQPNNNILGMWIAMINLHVGDSVTLVIPSQSAYGTLQRDPIKPFSTLIYHMKLTKVVKYDK